MTDIIRRQTGDNVILIGEGSVTVSIDGGITFTEVDVEDLEAARLELADDIEIIMSSVESAYEDANRLEDWQEYLAQGIDYLEELEEFHASEGCEICAAHKEYEDDEPDNPFDALFEEAASRVFDAFTEIYKNVEPDVHGKRIVTDAEIATASAIAELHSAVNRSLK